MKLSHKRLGTRAYTNGINTTAQLMKDVQNEVK